MYWRWDCTLTQASERQRFLEREKRRQVIVAQQHHSCTWPGKGACDTAGIAWDGSQKQRGSQCRTPSQNSLCSHGSTILMSHLVCSGMGVVRHLKPSACSGQIRPGLRLRAMRLRRIRGQRRDHVVSRGSCSSASAVRRPNSERPGARPPMCSSTSWGSEVGVRRRHPWPMSPRIDASKPGKRLRMGRVRWRSLSAAEAHSARKCPLPMPLGRSVQVSTNIGMPRLWARTVTCTRASVVFAHSA